MHNSYIDLLAPPFNLPWGSSIYSYVIATNIVGSSAGSNVGDGAVILTAPDPPVTVYNIPSLTNAYRIGM